MNQGRQTMALTYNGMNSVPNGTEGKYQNIRLPNKALETKPELKRIPRLCSVKDTQIRKVTIPGSVGTIRAPESMIQAKVTSAAER
ncbi:hypothetical protein C2S51_014374 [Perilla frutescens var. frutescens]|nr:hypothetical protein C2S51_014374 [Perilla frutescens var. frutescens]